MRAKLGWRGWLARLFPRSLFRQNLLLIVALILLGQLASGLIFVFAIQKPRVAMLANLSARQIMAIQSAAAQIPVSGRDAFIKELNRQQSVQVLPASAVALDLSNMAAFGEPESRPLRLFTAALRRELGDQAGMVRWHPADQTLWVGLLLAGDPYWVRLDPRRFDPAAPWALFAMSLASAVLALFGAVWISRRINRPLDSLVQAAEALGQGEKPPRLAESGPTEIATVARSFNRMAENLNEAECERAIMLAGVSHDLRTPLTKLRLALDISEQRLEPGLFAQMVHYVEDIDGLLDQFLDFARLGSDEALAEVNLRAMIEQLAGDFARRGHPFRLELAALPALQARPKALLRLLVNLMDNAVKYGEQGLMVRAAVARGHCQIAVIDRGPGISADEAERLLQPFTRGNEARQGKPGAGLGLAIVKRIVSLHAGVLALNSPPAGQLTGLEVSVSLPLNGSNSAETG